MDMSIASSIFSLKGLYERDRRRGEALKLSVIQ